jgi:hypothetical protein
VAFYKDQLYDDLHCSNVTLVPSVSRMQLLVAHSWRSSLCSVLSSVNSEFPPIALLRLRKMKLLPAPGSFIAWFTNSVNTTLPHRQVRRVAYLECVSCCPQITGVNVLSAVRGEYKACRWPEDYPLVSDKEKQ